MRHQFDIAAQLLVSGKWRGPAGCGWRRGCATCSDQCATTTNLGREPIVRRCIVRHKRVTAAWDDGIWWVAKFITAGYCTLIIHFLKSNWIRLPIMCSEHSDFPAKVMFLDNSRRWFHEFSCKRISTQKWVKDGKMLTVSFTYGSYCRAFLLMQMGMRSQIVTVE